MPAERSPGYRAVSLVYEESRAKSLRRLNDGLYYALLGAVRAGLRFDKPDFCDFVEWFGGVYWLSDGEVLYAKAVRASNISACQSIETWLKRPPYILDGKRLYVGASVSARYLGTSSPGAMPSVTSISADHVIVCTYDRAETRKVRERKRLSLKDIRSLNRAMREAA